MALPTAWARKLRPMRWSVFRWPMTGSTAERRRSSRLIASVTRLSQRSIGWRRRLARCSWARRRGDKGAGRSCRLLWRAGRRGATRRRRGAIPDAGRRGRGREAAPRERQERPGLLQARPSRRCARKEKEPVGAHEGLARREGRNQGAGARDGGRPEGRRDAGNTLRDTSV